MFNSNDLSKGLFTLFIVIILSTVGIWEGCKFACSKIKVNVELVK